MNVLVDWNAHFEVHESVDAVALAEYLSAVGEERSA